MEVAVRFGGFFLVLSILLQARPVSPQVCSGNRTLNAYRGQRYTLKSPGYPSSYPNFFDCTWIISAPAGYYVKITFTTFRTELTHDFMEIRDGQNSFSRILAKYSGTKSRFFFVSTGNKLRIRFFTDSSVTNQGFYASYEVVDGSYTTGSPTSYAYPWPTTSSSNACSENRSLYADGAQRYTLKSPGFPSSYPNNLNCTWIIAALAGFRVKITFTTFRTELKHDYIDVRDGQYSNSFLLAKQSGTKSRFSFTSSGSKLRIRFVTDSSITFQGFYASYEQVDGSYTPVPPTLYVHPWPTTSSSTSNKCFGGVEILRDKSGSLGYTSKFVQVTCRWLIVVPSSYKIRLQIEHLGSCSSSCTSYGNCDSVSVYEGPNSGYSSSRLGVYCGNKKPPPIYLDGHVMLVVFKASYYGVHVFKATYESVRLTPKEEKLTIGLTVVSAAFFFTLIISLCCCCKRKELRMRQHRSPPTFSGRQVARVPLQPQRVELVSLPEEAALVEGSRAEGSDGQVTEPSVPQLNIPDEAPPPYQQSAGNT